MYKDLLLKIESAPWLHNLGNYQGNTPCIKIESIDDWKNYMVAASLDEFNISGERPHTSIPNIRWIDDDMKLSDVIIEKRGLLEKTVEYEEFKKQRKNINRAILKAIRFPENSNWLIVENMNLTGAVSASAVFLGRNAYTEAYFNLRCKFSLLFGIFLEGNWPLGYTENNELLVL